MVYTDYTELHCRHCMRLGYRPRPPARWRKVKKEEALKKARKDDRLPKVVLSEKRQKRSAK